MLAMSRLGSQPTKRRALRGDVSWKRWAGTWVGVAVRRNCVFAFPRTGAPPGVSVPSPPATPNGTNAVGSPRLARSTTKERPVLDRLTAPGPLLRVESLVLLAVAVGAYAWHDGSWLLFALLILAPDLSALGYLSGPRVGAATYNLAHAFVLPGILLAFGAAGSDLALDLALIWGAHIAADRALGYGLKYPEGFKSTHIQRVERR